MKFFYTPVLVCLLFLTSCGLPTNSKQAQQQTILSCGIDALLQQLRANDPAFAKKEKEKAYREAMINPQKKITDSLCVLPVVVHIIHDGGSENISDAQVLPELDNLNQAFRNIGYYNPTTGTDIAIEFCLAQRDPSKNATSGVRTKLFLY